ncbi:MAG: methionine--tRNA ligase subunit beta [bacterium]|nr:methionine--tRNA ligase subunit beta [bacterium]
MITIDQFKQVEMAVGMVMTAVNQEGSEKLIKLTVDLGEENPRTIYTAVRPFGYTPEDFINKKFIFVTNLEPKKIMDDYSQGMIMAVDGPDNRPVFLLPAADVAIGARVR